MWDSSYFLEQYARERSKTLSEHLARCRLAEQYQRRATPRWRRTAARGLASLSVRLDYQAARAALEAGLFLR